MAELVSAMAAGWNTTCSRVRVPATTTVKVHISTATSTGGPFNMKRDFPSMNGVEDLLILSLSNGSLSGSSGRKLGHNGKCSKSSVVDIVLW